MRAGRAVREAIWSVDRDQPAPALRLTFVAVPALLAAVGALACWVPARRAARVDPAITLQGE